METKLFLTFSAVTPGKSWNLTSQWNPGSHPLKPPSSPLTLSLSLASRHIEKHSWCLSEHRHQPGLQAVRSRWYKSAITRKLKIASNSSLLTNHIFTSISVLFWLVLPFHQSLSSPQNLIQLQHLTANHQCKAYIQLAKMSHRARNLSEKLNLMFV